MKQGQAEALMPMIERVLGECGADYTILDRMAVTVGPGSFTGVRVGIAAARARCDIRFHFLRALTRLRLFAARCFAVILRLCGIFVFWFKGKIF